LSSSAGNSGYHSSGSSGLGLRGSYPPHLSMSHQPSAPRSPMSPSHSQHSPTHSPLHSSSSRDSRKRRAPPLSSYNSPSIVLASLRPLSIACACARWCECAKCVYGVIRAASSHQIEAHRHPRQHPAVADLCLNIPHTLWYVRFRTRIGLAPLANLCSSPDDTAAVVDRPRRCFPSVRVAPRLLRQLGDGDGR
jgi:hypothetical protein